MINVDFVYVIHDINIQFVISNFYSFVKKSNNKFAMQQKIVTARIKKFVKKIKKYNVEVKIMIQNMKTIKFFNCWIVYRNRRHEFLFYRTKKLI